MCIFCKIASHEVPSYKIYENDHVLAFLDLSQTSIGHTLVIPKKHFNNILELDDNSAADVFKVVTYLSKKISKNLDVKNLNIINNNGPLAGQTVDHFHIHIIPRYDDDEISFNYPSHKLTEEEFNRLKEKILAN